MRSDIYTATAMNNDADAALQEAVHKLWQAAMSQHQDRFVVHSLNHAATLVTSETAVLPSLARRVVGATPQIHATEQILITAVLVVEVLAR
jgi:hypothetical protein